MSLSNRLTGELPYLEAFHAVCTAGGFTAAARRLKVSQPAVSYQVRSLEKALRVRLVERGSRRLLLTTDGERVRAFCDDLFRGLTELRNGCRDIEARERMRLGSASGFGRYVLMPALRSMMSEQGDRELVVRFDSADVILDGLEAGEYDAVFVYKRRISNLLRYRNAYAEELVLIAPPEMRDAVIDTVDAFDGLRMVTYMEGDYVFGRWFESVLGDMPAQIRSASHFSELEEVIEMVSSGAGPSIVPLDSARAAIARGAVVRKHPLGAPRCINQVYLVMRSGSAFRPDLQDLLMQVSARAALQ